MKYTIFKWLSPTGCLIALAGFFLVFTEVNCNGKTLDTITGIELATGYSPDIDLVQSDDPEAESTEKEKEKEKYDPNIFALNGILAALIGLVLFLIPGMRKQHLLHLVVVAIGFVSLIGLMINLKSELAKATNGKDSIVNLNLDLTFDMQFGYWLVTACFAISIIADIFLIRSTRSTVPTPEDTEGT